ncbi:hypothetical protein Aduo_003150 [Ancylostoma duodenale]
MYPRFLVASKAARPAFVAHQLIDAVATVKGNDYQCDWRDGGESWRSDKESDTVVCVEDLDAISRRQSKILGGEKKRIGRKAAQGSVLMCKVVLNNFESTGNSV